MDIVEISNIPEKEEIHLKKDFLGWRIVHPIRNKDGTTNYLNLLVGGWRNLLNLVVVLLLLGFILVGYINDVQNIKDYYGEIANNPDMFCFNRGKIRQADGVNLPNDNQSWMNLTTEVKNN